MSNMGKTFDPSIHMSRVKGEYRFIRAEGVGVCEIIEPGHFRFQAVREDILNLEEKLGYVSWEKMFLVRHQKV